MTRQRRYGTDTPFGQWIRTRRDIDSQQHGLLVNDADWILYQYKTSIEGVKAKSSDLALMMLVEVKTRGGLPGWSQQNVLWQYHNMTTGQRRVPIVNSLKCPLCWNFGCFVLSLENEEPKDGDKMRWLQFTTEGGFRSTVFRKVFDIVNILGFTNNPNDPKSKLKFYYTGDTYAIRGSRLEKKYTETYEDALNIVERFLYKNSGTLKENRCEFPSMLLNRIKRKYKGQPSKKKEVLKYAKKIYADECDDYQ